MRSTKDRIKNLNMYWLNLYGNRKGSVWSTKDMKKKMIIYIYIYIGYMYMMKGIMLEKVVEKEEKLKNRLYDDYEIDFILFVLLLILCFL